MLSEFSALVVSETGSVFEEDCRIDALLIHSPLVGPLTVMPLADELRTRGWSATAPDLRAALSAPRPQWRAVVDLVLSASSSPGVIIGHSGAGVLLPVLADALNPEFVCFVDAVVPPGETSYEASVEFVEFIDSLDHDGVLLPPWHEWWGPDVMDDLVPDVAQRALLVADTPRVPRSFYDDPVQLPRHWRVRRRCSMLQLSPAYSEDRVRADSYGWATGSINAQHLDIATRPQLVCDHVTQLIEVSSSS